MTMPLERGCLAFVTPLRDLVTLAAHAFAVTEAELVGPDRSRPIILYRQCAMAAAREMGASYPAIGRAFGNRDHTTVINAVRVVGSDDEMSHTAMALAGAMKNQQRSLF